MDAEFAMHSLRPPWEQIQVVEIDGADESSFPLNRGHSFQHAPDLEASSTALAIPSCLVTLANKVNNVPRQFLPRGVE